MSYSSRPIQPLPKPLHEMTYDEQYEYLCGLTRTPITDTQYRPIDQPSLPLMLDPTDRKDTYGLRQYLLQLGYTIVPTNQRELDCERIRAIADKYAQREFELTQELIALKEENERLKK